MAQRLLITGGAGFIGVNAARYFAKKGWAVIILDNFSRKGADVNAEALRAESPDITVIKADVRKDMDGLAKAVANTDAVLHLAAQVAVTTSVVDPRNDMEQNIVGTFNVLEAIRQSANKPPIIYSSTNKVYGALEAFPVREAEKRYEFIDEAYRSYGVPETAQLDFHSPYGCSKGAADQYVIDYGRIYGLKTLALRQSCIYGEHQFGVEDQGWLAWFTIAAMQGRPITIYGTGKQVRDALFAEDLARLYEMCFSKIDTINARAYNVGGGPGNTISLIELLDRIKNEFGYTPQLSSGETRAGDQPIFVADIRALERDYGWKPEVSVKDGVTRMHAWFVKHKEIIQKVLNS